MLYPAMPELSHLLTMYIIVSLGLASGTTIVNVKKMTKQIQVKEKLRAPFNYINTLFAHHLPYYNRIK